MLQRLNRRRRAYTFRRVFLPDISHTSRMTLRSALFWVAAACCVVAELASLKSLLFGRARAADQRPTTGPLASVHRASRPVEIAWAIIPAVGLLFVLYLTWRAVDPPVPSARDVSHRVASVRFAWGRSGSEAFERNSSSLIARSLT